MNDPQFNAMTIKETLAQGGPLDQFPKQSGFHVFFEPQDFMFMRSNSVF